VTGHCFLIEHQGPRKEEKEEEVYQSKTRRE
jgi:hypothetical protein